MPGPWPRPAGWGPTGQRTGRRRRNGMCGGRSRCARPWYGRARGPSFSSGPCCGRRACTCPAAGPRPSSTVSTPALPEPLHQAIGPMLPALEMLNRQVTTADRALEEQARSDPRVRRLDTAPGIGPVTAATFVATLDRADRFAGPHQLEAYLGLVPREYSSGERQVRGRITKGGNTRLRCLLIEAAWSIVNYPKPETAALRQWTLRIAGRRGMPRAVVALARRLAGILFAMMRDETVYDSSRLTSRSRPARVA